jgi:Kef-type K+ transport system membrane component KefB
VAATAGKQLCALGVLESGVNRFTVGMGMVPRGEVGLIFAHLGLSLKFHGASVIDGSTYSAVVFMVLVTTFLTPPALAWSFRRKPST